MLLITEQNFHGIECITEESKEDGSKKMYIEGIFMQANKKNRNGRIYEESILQPVVNTFINEKVNSGMALGELEHPSSPKITLERVSHRITELKWQGDDVYGKALVMNTPTGNIVRGLLEGGSRLGVSSRGMGSLEKRKDGFTYVKEDYSLATVDVVQDPSAQDAFINGILEGVEFIFSSDGRIIQERAEKFEEKAVKKVKKVKKKSEIAIDESAELRKLQRFLASL